MKFFNKNPKNIISTVAFAICLMRLVEIEENQLAKILELVMLAYRILSIVNSLVFKDGPASVDDGN